jgi:nucleoside diphosphate kinase
MAEKSNIGFTILKKGTAGNETQENFIKRRLLRAGFTITDEQTITFPKEVAEEWYKHKQSEVPPHIYEEIIENKMTKNLVILFLEREDSICVWEALRAVMGATNPEKAGKVSDEWCRKLGLPLETLSIRAEGKLLFGWDIGLNGLHGSDSEKSLQKELELIAIALDENQEDQENTD